MSIFVSDDIRQVIPEAAILAEHDDEERKALHVVLCGEAAFGMRALCLQQGVTVTAFLDALGHVLGELARQLPAPNLSQVSPTVELATGAARRIDGQRRSRH